MIAPDAPDPEEQLAALLAACDEAMAAGVPAESFCSVAAPVPLRARLQRDLECMQVLRRLRQSSTPNGFSTSSSSDTAVVAPEAPLPEGTRLGRFEIRRELGRGGYGVVLLAYDPNLGREIALKIPRPDVLITAELRARFQHEGRAAAGLDHPHIVPVHEAGEI